MVSATESFDRVAQHNATGPTSSNWTTNEPAASANPAKNSQLAAVPHHTPDEEEVAAGSDPPVSPTAKEYSPKLP
jgi:hypothetical protein